MPFPELQDFQDRPVPEKPPRPGYSINLDGAVAKGKEVAYTGPKPAAEIVQNQERGVATEMQFRKYASGSFTFPAQTKARRPSQQVFPKRLWPYSTSSASAMRWRTLGVRTLSIPKSRNSFRLPML